MSLEQDVALLRGVPTFRALAPEALRVLAVSAEQRKLAPGELLFRTGDKADGAYVVVSGRMEVYAESGGKRRAGCDVLPGGLIGETALILDRPRPATAAALDAAVVLRIPRATFLRMLESYPDAALEVRRAFAQRVESLLGSLDTVRDKLETPVLPPRRKR
ncbi:cyclic nucleotide-binding protein [Azorhizobium oxalatiphilum]|uniref:Cyclic nucleotide-binding protein n=1 Tax=Azorhizobium oxalatiphilum TaxID=980631 RepID=A0A917FFR2_9HYPH|nr:cyclic nucleotide-binding domain-containing protein [Azorhizobium oxalatiphilum]GGF80638.1 cyclic nucleotide-binding protein [Azorhizobium oxalatiphilum]